MRRRPTTQGRPWGALLAAALVLGLAKPGAAQGVPDPGALPNVVFRQNSNLERYWGRVMGALILPRPVLTPEEELEPMQLRQQLSILRFRDVHSESLSSLGLGSLIFGAASTIAAHGPEPVRWLFRPGRWNLGPMILDRGMGAGFVARF